MHCRRGDLGVLVIGQICTSCLACSAHVGGALSPSNFRMRAHIHPDSRLSSLIHLPHVSKHQFFEVQVSHDVSQPAQNSQ